MWGTSSNLQTLVRARFARHFAVLCALLIVAATVVSPRPASAVTTCLDSAEQSKLVADSEIVPLSAALNKRKVQKRGTLVEASVCRNHKGYFYLMTMESAVGEVKVVRVQADLAASAQPEFQLKHNCYFAGRSWSTGTICRFECTGDACARQYCKANGEWQSLARCPAEASCRPYKSC